MHIEPIYGGGSRMTTLRRPSPFIGGRSAPDQSDRVVGALPRAVPLGSDLRGLSSFQGSFLLRPGRSPDMFPVGSVQGSQEGRTSGRPPADRGRTAVREGTPLVGAGGGGAPLQSRNPSLGPDSELTVWEHAHHGDHGQLPEDVLDSA
jgi:hypothetical protein